MERLQPCKLSCKHRWSCASAVLYTFTEIGYRFQVVKALHYLQAELKVIHRDVKPSNILINRNGQVKMCDFGISGNLVDSVAKTIDAGCKPYMAVSD